MGMVEKIQRENAVGRGEERAEKHERLARIASGNNSIMNSLAPYIDFCDECKNAYEMASSECHEVKSFVGKQIGVTANGSPLYQDTAKFSTERLRELENNLRVMRGKKSILVEKGREQKEAKMKAKLISAKRSTAKTKQANKEEN